MPSSDTDHGHGNGNGEKVVSDKGLEMFAVGEA